MRIIATPRTKSIDEIRGACCNGAAAAVASYAAALLPTEETGIEGSGLVCDHGGSRRRWWQVRYGRPQQRQPSRVAGGRAAPPITAPRRCRIGRASARRQRRESAAAFRPGTLRPSPAAVGDVLERIRHLRARAQRSRQLLV